MYEDWLKNINDSIITVIFTEDYSWTKNIDYLLTKIIIMKYAVYVLKSRVSNELFFNSTDKKWFFFCLFAIYKNTHHFKNKYPSSLNMPKIYNL